VAASQPRRPGRQLLTTSIVFYPNSVDLVLHSHSLLNAFAGATVFGRAPLPVALNLTLLLGCALNGFVAYILALRVSRHWRASCRGRRLLRCLPPLHGAPLRPLQLLHGVAARRVRRGLAARHGAAVMAVGGSRRRRARGGRYADYYYFVYALVSLCSWS
jgi:hypothetical protein